MPWLIGIDEAGYGPNLGPLVMTSVALHVPDQTDRWQTLRSAVRRAGDKDEGQFLVDDSKAVFGSARGLRALETSVLATLHSWPIDPPLSLHGFLNQLAPDSMAELQAECWYLEEQGQRCILPLEAAGDTLESHSTRWTRVCAEANTIRGPVRTILLCPAHFNALVERAGSKGAALAHCLTRLIRLNLTLLPEEQPVSFFVDKHGGRNTYAAILQEALSEGMVLAQQESMLRSDYLVMGLSRGVRFTMQPRADQDHFEVALASMISKYIREVLMDQFNQYWQALVPGLEPTAGYPVDAGRFFKAIQPVLRSRGLDEDSIWRRK